jgi:glucose/arabinose dehydrogenase
MRPLILLVMVAVSLTLSLAPRAMAQARFEQMDYGAFFSSSVTMPWSRGGENVDGVTTKGITVKLEHGANICFDTDLIRYAAGWSGGWLKLMGTPFDGTHRPPEGSRPAVVGKLVFGSKPKPGWAGEEGDFRDPRHEPYGPLPGEQAKYRGLSVSGDRVIFSYTVNGCAVLDLPGAEKIGDAVAITRTLYIAAHARPLELLVAEIGTDFGNRAGYDGSPPSHGDRCQSLGDLSAGLAGHVSGLVWKIDQATRLSLVLPAAEKPSTVKLVLARVPVGELEKALDRPIIVPLLLTVSGVARFPETVTTRGRLGDPGGDAAYVVDTLTLPDDNPWKSWMRIGGFDFFPGGARAALCTWSGDVWVVSGIDEDLKNLEWRRVASGLFQPLGLKIVDGKIYVLGRDQITRLHDVTGDGEMNWYECFNNDIGVTPNFHEFVYGLETDPDGNFYFTKGAPLLGTQYFDPTSAHNGCVLRVSKDGKKLDRFATGLRAPNGVGAGPSGQITCSDNEGIWTPVCRLNWVRQGGFYGCMGMHHTETPPKTYDPPLCWLPYSVDNSAGGQVWVEGDRWGPYSGEMLHLSYGRCALFHVLKQEIGDVVQGGVVKFPLAFDSGVMRGRFNPRDGQLYLAGLRGWQSSAARDGTFQRVRYTGKTVQSVRAMRVTSQGIELDFTVPLDRDLAEDLDSYNIQQWNYRWSKEYGSDLYSPSEPEEVIGKKGSLKGERLAVAAAVLSDDGKTVALSIPSIAPVMQIAIELDLESRAGGPIVQQIYGTINSVPEK